MNYAYPISRKEFQRNKNFEERHSKVLLDRFLQGSRAGSLQEEVVEGAREWWEKERRRRRGLFKRGRMEQAETRGPRNFKRLTAPSHARSTVASRAFLPLLQPQFPLLRGRGRRKRSGRGGENRGDEKCLLGLGWVGQPVSFCRLPRRKFHLNVSL